MIIVPDVSLLLVAARLMPGIDSITTNLQVYVLDLRRRPPDIPLYDTPKHAQGERPTAWRLEGCPRWWTCLPC